MVRAFGYSTRLVRTTSVEDAANYGTSRSGSTRRVSDTEIKTCKLKNIVNRNKIENTKLDEYEEIENVPFRYETR